MALIPGDGPIAGGGLKEQSIMVDAVEIQTRNCDKDGGGEMRSEFTWAGACRPEASPK
jgi:hypothetical protein